MHQVIPEDFAVVLTGGGARAAYQVGVLRHLARLRPEARIPIITGVSAGAINAAFLAAHPGDLDAATKDLQSLWEGIKVQSVFRTDIPFLTRNFLFWMGRLASGGSRRAPKVQGLVDTGPLAELLARSLGPPGGPIPGIAANLAAGHLKAIALTSLNYGTGQTITWVQGRNVRPWRRALRRSQPCELQRDHVLASAALPLLFPAVRLNDGWHGDGGIRLTAPLSPAVHLGARRLLVITTRFRELDEEREVDHDPESELAAGAYPPPAQILGKLLNAIFLDLVDQDVRRFLRFNEVVRRLPPERRGQLEEMRIQVFRPSVDLGKLSAEFEPDLPRGFRFLTRSLGTRETKSPDFLSLLMFEPEYLRRLIEIGERDAEENRDVLLGLLDP